MSQEDIGADHPALPAKIVKSTYALFSGFDKDYGIQLPTDHFSDLVLVYIV